MRKLRRFIKGLGKSPEKVFGFVFYLQFLLQNLLTPVAYFMAAAPVKAVSSEPSVALTYNSSNHNFGVRVDHVSSAEYELVYDYENSSAPQNITANQTANNGIIDQQYPIGTQSGGDWVYYNLTQGKFSLKATDLNNQSFFYQAQVQVTDNVLWIKEGDSYQVFGLEANRTYQAPNNQSVSVTFNNLPSVQDDQPWWLRIESVNLDSAKQQELGALSNQAYDITSNLPDGSFSYDLTLPNPNPQPATETNETIVQFSEDGQTYEEAANPTTVSNDLITVRELDHFTVFVVTTPKTISNCDAVTLDSGTYDACYGTIQEAIDAADPSDGIDSIYVGSGTYNENAVINKSIKILGNNRSIPAQETRLSETIINGYFKISSSDVTVSGFTFQNGAPVPAGELSAIYISGGQDNILITNNILSRNGAAPNGFDASRGIINEFGGIDNLNIKSNSFNGWHTGVFSQHAKAEISGNTFSVNMVAISSDYPEDITIQNNLITDNAFEGIGVGGTINKVSIRNNSLTNNAVAISNYDSANILDSSNNWYGSNNENTFNFNGAVDYSPWLANAEDTSSEPGFQGDFTSLYVSDNSPRANNQNPILEAMELVTGSTIVVTDGVYPELIATGTYPSNTIIKSQNGPSPNYNSRGQTNRIHF